MSLRNKTELEILDFYVATEKPEKCMEALNKLCKKYALDIDFEEVQDEQIMITCDDFAIAYRLADTFLAELDLLCKKFASPADNYCFKQLYEECDIDFEDD
jgi:hypothetical protein